MFEKTVEEFFSVPPATLSLCAQQSCPGDDVNNGVQVERATGVEPASEAWEASILPMNYARVSSVPYLTNGMGVAPKVRPPRQ